MKNIHRDVEQERYLYIHSKINSILQIQELDRKYRSYLAGQGNVEGIRDDMEHGIDNATYRIRSSSKIFSKIF